ncbi:hypothetical protein ACU5DF_23410 [Aliivibrio wodanis]|uniref:hypothetical protein n=1 Tax=Aliivibrio wodanis TaxID=80852 RepID=UPI00406C3628
MNNKELTELVLMTCDDLTFDDVQEIEFDDQFNADADFLKARTDFIAKRFEVSASKVTQAVSENIDIVRHEISKIVKTINFDFEPA